MPRDCVALAAADLEWLMAANPEDNLEAAYWIGYCHYWGTGGVEENNDSAVLYFQKAANNAKALWRLADCYRYGFGVTKDETRATQVWKQANAALQSDLQKDPNDAEAQSVLGASYHWGMGDLNKDRPRAFSLYQQAAQQGHVNGQYGVACLLEYGGGVAKDCVQAVGWYGLAARQGHSTARKKFDNLFEEEAELNEQLAVVARDGALDQQETFLAASALAYYWTQTIGANFTTAQQWQEIANKCTNRVPSSWKPCILAGAARSLSPSSTIQNRKEEPDRQPQLVALVKELQVYCNSNSADNPVVFRVLGYCHDHGIGVEHKDPLRAIRCYVKADELAGIKPELRQGSNTNTETAATTETGCTSAAEWLYCRLKDERVTKYETRFELDQALEGLRTTVKRAKTALDSATVQQALGDDLEVKFLQGLLGMDQFVGEAKLEEKARGLVDQANRTENFAERLPLIEALERVQAQLKKEVEAREENEPKRLHHTAS